MSQMSQLRGDNDGDFHAIKVGIGEYMARFYENLFADTLSMDEFCARGLSRSIQIVPDRMVDAVEDMLKQYQKNDHAANGNELEPGKGALFPIMLLALAKDYGSTMGDQGGKQIGRKLICLEDGGSVYGYRQGAGDLRGQVAVMAADAPTARSLAAQFTLFIGEVKNRRFAIRHKWGQYILEFMVTIENPDIVFSKVDVASTNMSVLITDMNLHVILPYFDAPAKGEDNDGSDNNPPGYPVVQIIEGTNEQTERVWTVVAEDDA